MPDQTNSLAQASSAYLRSAMHQPIRWYQWGEEAFAAAQRENKPMLLDIGAVWCHWCHVMDRESYDDPEVARIINENFIAMKVDRDERPDIDSRYQSAVQAMAGQGGWPLTAFLTPEGKPFYGGTYFPPDDQWGRPGFKRVLMAIADAFRGKRDEVSQQADMVLSSISQAESFAGRSASIPPTIVRSVIASALKIYDSEHGGFGSAPKFPHPSTMDLLIHLYSRSGDERLREVISNTLEHMARGGVYDQLGGGFHRYSVDERWVVPHFEKMSYDNSELLKNYVHGYQATGNPLFAAVARDIIRWMDAWLSDRSEGGFYASQDADINLDDDGDYFTWTLEEARAALNEEELKVAQPYYDINEAGEMHHNPAKNVLFVHASVEEIGVRTGMQRDRISALLDSAKDKMYAARLKRATPFVDKTVYVGWNALCVSAYLEAARVLSLEDARHFALRSLDRILSQGFTAEGGLKHVIAYADPQAPNRNVAGVLDDYAFTALACLDGYEATADLSYFTFARKIVDAMIERFYDQTSGGFFDSENKAALGALTARRKPFQDSPTPAGNSAAAIALFRMHAYTHEDSYREKAEDTLEVFAGMAEQYGMFAATYALAAVWLLEGHTQVVVVGNDERARELYAAAVAPFAVNKAVVKVSDSAAAPQNLPPVLAETVPNIPAVKDGKSTAVLCSNFTCQPPISDPDELAKVLHETLVAKAA
ncbi:MAG: thioredoxin domain-containing protein [Terriglobales bacterium]